MPAKKSSKSKANSKAKKADEHDYPDAPSVLNHGQFDLEMSHSKRDQSIIKDYGPWVLGIITLTFFGIVYLS